MPILEPDDKILYWNKVYRATLLCLVILMVGLVGFSAIKINETTRQTKDLIVANQKSTLEARKANNIRQDSLKGYIKCLSLLRFDDPTLLNTNVTKQQVSNALDKCAKETS